MQLLIGLLNAIAAMVFLYTVVSVPTQLVRRFRRRFKRELVSPIGLVIKEWSKGWLLMAIILIPLSSALTFFSSRNAGLDDAQIFTLIATQSVIGNIGTSLCFGYVWMMLNKGNWSLSGREKAAIKEA